MRKLSFSDVKSGDDAAAGPHTTEGAAAIMRQICPELTDEEAVIAAKEGERRAMGLDVGAIKAVLRELFERPISGAGESAATEAWDRVRATEATLLACATRARAEGIDIISDDFEERAGDRVTGVCILAAYERFARPGERLALPRGEEVFSRAWTSIELGFDGVPPGRARDSDDLPLLRRWAELGRRLREQLMPRKARTVEMEDRN